MTPERVLKQIVITDFMSQRVLFVIPQAGKTCKHVQLSISSESSQLRDLLLCSQLWKEVCRGPSNRKKKKDLCLKRSAVLEFLKHLFKIRDALFFF